MEKLRVLSLFAGIGGFDLGLERTGGFETVAVAEVNKYSSLILKLRFPDAPNVGDVTEAEYPDADIICAGFPCQDISFAGAGAGLAGSRSGLFWEVVRAIRLVRPRFVLLENVAALLGRGLDEVLRALAEIGYDTEWHCIPASAVGAPHQRDRIWIVANPSDDGHGNFDGLGENRRAQGETCCAEDERQWLRNEFGRSRAPLSGWLAEYLADAESERRGETWRVRHHEPTEWFASSGEVVADASSAGLSVAWPIADGQDGEQGGGLPSSSGWWAIEPDVGRVAHGIPKRVDRLRALGNAVVPQIPELIGRAILASLEAERKAA